MKNNTTSRSGLFLMELIISILFFSLAGAVCVKLFVNSHIISKSSVELNHSLEWSQNVAEVFYSCNGDIEKMAAVFQSQNQNCILYDADSSPSGNTELVLLFNSDFSPVINYQNSGMVFYFVSATVEQEDQLLYCHIQACDTDPENSKLEAQEVIYELTVSLYPQKEVQP